MAIKGFGRFRAHRARGVACPGGGELLHPRPGGGVRTVSYRAVLHDAYGAELVVRWSPRADEPRLILEVTLDRRFRPRTAELPVDAVRLMSAQHDAWTEWAIAAPAPGRATVPDGPAPMDRAAVPLAPRFDDLADPFGTRVLAKDVPEATGPALAVAVVEVGNGNAFAVLDLDGAHVLAAALRGWLRDVDLLIGTGLYEKRQP